MKKTIYSHDSISQTFYEMNISFKENMLWVNDRPCNLKTENFNIPNINESLRYVPEVMEAIKQFSEPLYYFVCAQVESSAHTVIHPSTGPSQWVMNMVWDTFLDQSINANVFNTTECYELSMIQYKNEILHIDAFGHYLDAYEITREHWADFIRISNLCRQFTVDHQRNIKSSILYQSCIQALVDGEDYQDVSSFYHDAVMLSNDTTYQKHRESHEILINI